MDTIALVDAQIDGGMSLLDRLREEGVAVDASCWVKAADEDRWSLYIATPLVDEKGPVAGYRTVNEVLRSMGLARVLDSQIKLIGTTNPAAKTIRELQETLPGYKSNVLLGATFAEEVFVYPSTSQQPVTIYGMAFRGGPSAPLHLSFEPHSPHCKLTVEDENGRREYPAQTGIDWVVAVPDRATLERDDTGRAVLGWELHGKHRQSDAQTAFSLAKLGLHGFRFLREPSGTGARSA
ncbi:hypothetical protein J8F10_29640 [Gemmata sp. G18]|uniref:Uncharacterized protein n=1 Tax=Gemmata palustris TaxID=2822762 RepID=A0ABS5C196_9BACT|nr:hypothetical protein [Gemmata palustris]MBP3959427.1 hypothetical protein [Gemmata palustris]